MSLAAPAGVFTGNLSITSDPLRDIADRISRLSYGEMKRLADEIHAINIKHSSFSFADGLHDWAQEKLANTYVLGR